MLRVLKPLAVMGIVACFLLCESAFDENRSAFAVPSLKTALLSYYPALRDTQLDSCATCHMPAKKDFLNDYAIALKEAKMDFEAIEELDSDNDGTSNIEEIKEETFPGSQAFGPEYFIFHVNFSEEDPEVGKVHFNHEMHVIKESFLSKGRCKNCHGGKHMFPRVFDDNVSVREIAHQVCWRCHETSGSKISPTDCTGCHTGVKEMLDDIKSLLN
ncbi:hypothetical protein LCGC14_2247520 [marine sediment metagenome]|uniref:Uncharacterized protein n=1 Tax=marine sediment metagenome TaxID=412755 RepID=A0A0F9D3B2_9ZZZZ